MVTNTVDINPAVSVISVLNALVKRQRWSVVKKEKAQLYMSERNLL